MRKFHIAILLLCCLAASFLFCNFLSHARGLWSELNHDRNGHYGYGLDMAEAVEHGQPGQFFNQLEKGKVWPPLHGVLVMVTQVLTGNDWRVAVLPSLTGWALTLFCVWFVAQKVAAPTGIGWAAGLVAFVFAALSPGGRDYATDVMLESLGAGLSMLAILFYMRAAVDRDSAPKWRALALTLTFLFFEKYNYWLIIVIVLTISEIGTLRAVAREIAGAIDWKATVRAQVRQPLNWVLLALVALVAGIVLHGRTSFHISGHEVYVDPAGNLLTVVFAVFFVRVAIAIRQTKWKPPETWQQMLWQWHILPLAVSFLLPQRLGIFFHFLSPANSGDAPTHSLPGTVAFYWQSFMTDYNVAQWAGILAVALACVALTRFKAFGPGARAVLICMLLGAALNIAHPNNKSRFLHSWLPALWTASGIGAAVLLGKIKAPQRGLIAGIGITALAIAGGRAAWLLPASTFHAESNSDLNMSDAWLAAVSDSPKVAFFSTQSGRAFIAWTFLDKRGVREQFEWPVFQQAGTPDEFRKGFGQWLAQTSAEAVVFLDVPPESPMFAGICDQPVLRQEMDTLMAAQKKFQPSGHMVFPGKNYNVTIWHAAAK